MTEQEAILTEALDIERQLNNDLKQLLAREKAQTKVYVNQLQQVLQANQSVGAELAKKSQELEELKLKHESWDKEEEKVIVHPDLSEKTEATT